MKFFTCCSHKIETQTVEPQVLPEQTDQPQASQNQNIKDANVSSQSVNDVSFFGDFKYFRSQFQILHTQVYLNARMCTGWLRFYSEELVKETFITGLNSLLYPD